MRLYPEWFSETLKLQLEMEDHEVSIYEFNRHVTSAEYARVVSKNVHYVPRNYVRRVIKNTYGKLFKREFAVLTDHVDLLQALIENWRGEYGDTSFDGELVR